VFANAKLMICDLKAGTPRLHELGCGTGNEQILENLNILFRDYKGGIWIRIPCIPGFNDTEREFRVIGKLLSGKRVERVEVTPYHDWGVPKYRALGREYRRLGPGLLERDSLAGLKRTLAEAGVNNIV
jgi:pyruvate formate lyase activating enzyme